MGCPDSTELFAVIGYWWLVWKLAGWWIRFAESRGWGWRGTADG